MLVQRLRAIGATVTKAGKLRYRKGALTPDERAAVEADRERVTRAVASLLEIERAASEEEARDEARARAAVAESEARARRESLMHRAAVMSEWDWDEVRAKAAAGHLTQEDVVLWREVRAARIRRAYLDVMQGALTQAFGREIRIVEWFS